MAEAEGVVEEGALRSRDGTALHVRRVAAAGPCRGRLAFVHGFGEHGGRYAHVLRWFAQRGFASHVVDLRGHGRAQGRRTYVTRFEEFLDDAEVFLHHVAGAGEGPLFLIGHSMGGLVAARTLECRAGLPPLAGAVLTSPFLALGFQVPLWKETAGKLLSRWIPWLRLPADVNPDALSTDPQVGRDYLADPLVVTTATSRWFTEALAAQRRALAEAPSIRLPLLVQHGDADTVARAATSERFCQAAGSADKTWRSWPDLRHELFNERSREEVFAFLLAWFERHLG